jgi:hypothetical protein
VNFIQFENNFMAILAYMEADDPEKTPRGKSVLPLSKRSGPQLQWPTTR